MTDLNDEREAIRLQIERKAIRLQIEQLLIKAAKLDEIEREANDSRDTPEKHLDEKKLERFFQEMHQERQHSLHEQAELRIKRVKQHNPGLLRKAARKYLAGESLSDDEFLLSHRGYFRDEWTDEMETEWRFILTQQYWHMLFSQLFKRL